MRNSLKCTHCSYFKFQGSGKLLPLKCQPKVAEEHCCLKDDGAAVLLVYSELLKLLKNGSSYPLEIPLKSQIYSSVVVCLRLEPNVTHLS